MLRRRCRPILVIDADTDPGCAMFDLGDAIRKASIDLGATVTMQNRMPIYSRAMIESGEGAQATRRRNRNDHATAMAFAARLLYVKPCLLREIPAEVRAYAVQNPSFPHEPILDQWFSESQFESYRRLGACQLGGLTGVLRSETLGSLLRTAFDQAIGSGAGKRADPVR